MCMYFCHDQIQTESLKHIGETNKSREEAMMAQLSDSVKHAGGRGGRTRKKNYKQGAEMIKIKTLK